MRGRRSCGIWGCRSWRLLGLRVAVSWGLCRGGEVWVRFMLLEMVVVLGKMEDGVRVRMSAWWDGGGLRVCFHLLMFR